MNLALRTTFACCAAIGCLAVFSGLGVAAETAGGDPLEAFEIVEEGDDPSGKEFVKEHRLLEAEIRARRKHTKTGERELVKMRIASTKSLADFAQQMTTGPLPRREAEDGEAVRSIRVESETRTAAERAAMPVGMRPPTLREYVLEEGRKAADRLRVSPYEFAKFRPEFPRNAAGTALGSSVTSPFTEEIETEPTEILRQVFRSHRYFERVHPGVRQRMTFHTSP